MAYDVGDDIEKESGMGLGAVTAKLCLTKCLYPNM